MRNVLANVNNRNLALGVLIQWADGRQIAAQPTIKVAEPLLSVTIAQVSRGSLGLHIDSPFLNARSQPKILCFLFWLITKPFL